MKGFRILPGTPHGECVYCVFQQSSPPEAYRAFRVAFYESSGHSPIYKELL
ncbi:hypothetical protein GCM10009414_01500 [Tatumella terrea]